MQFRNYNDANDTVKLNYQKQRQNQSLDYVKNMSKKYNQFSTKLSMQDCFASLNNFIDLSDPDITLPNIHHLLQTAEAIRKDNQPDWLQLIGLIHDLGKLIYLKGCNEDGTSLQEQWGIVGDTYILGCELPETNIYKEYNKLCPDINNQTKYGIYEQNCGLDNCYITYGHDEYLYQVLKYNKTTIPQIGLDIIRYHSLYPWHKYNEYQHLMNEKDIEVLKWTKLFNKYDLYSKEDNEFHIDNLMLYYTPIIEKYIGTYLYI